MAEKIEEQDEGWTWKDTLGLMADFTPVVGDVKGVYDTKMAYDEGDYVGAGINAIATGIGVIPIVGDAAGKGLKAGAAALRGTDEAIAGVNRQMSNADYLEMWDQFEDIETPDEWQAQVKQFVAENREINPDVRTPELEESAQRFARGEIDRAQHLQTIDEFKPVKSWDQLPREPSDKQLVYSLKSNQRRDGNFVLDDAAAKSLGVNPSPIEEGMEFQGRLDIPAYKEYDTWIVTGTLKGVKEKQYAKAIHYEGKDGSPVEFIANAGMGGRIARGEVGKTPYARIKGFVKSFDEEAIRRNAEDLIDDPEWTQVGFDPRRQSSFFVRGGENNGVPVREASEVIQIGPLVFAKNATLEPDYAGFNEGGLMAKEDRELPPDMYRRDGSTKSEQGFLGPVKNAVTGKTMTELSIGIEINGQEMEVPAMVPTLTPEEIEILRTNDFEGRAQEIPQSIMEKARDHALSRLEQGMNVFYQDGENEQPEPQMQEAAPAEQDMAEIDEEDVRADVPQMYHGGLMDSCSGEMADMDVAPPPGALDEEVADDIPAFLSTGEFVLPADVVRWHGLKHIMEMRDEAKAGLMAMEYEGQIQEVETEEYDGEGAMDSEVSYEDGAGEEGGEELLAEVAEEPIEGGILETAIMSVSEMGSEICDNCNGRGCEECMGDGYYPSEEGQFSFTPSVSFALIK